MSLKLDLVKLVFTLRLQHDVTDPFALFGIRPYFEEAFRAVAQCRGDSGRCSGGDSCSYHRTFSQALSADAGAIKRYQKPSLPFVFQVPVLSPPHHAGATVELGLVLAGTAINLLADYVAAVETMCAGYDFRKVIARVPGPG